MWAGLRCAGRPSKDRRCHSCLRCCTASDRPSARRAVSFWDLSRLFLHPSGDLPVILSWDCFTSPRTQHKPTLPQASRRSYARQGHSAVPCSLRSPGLAGGTPRGSQGYNDCSRISGSAAYPSSERAKTHSPQVSSREDERRQYGSRASRPCGSRESDERDDPLQIGKC